MKTFTISLFIIAVMALGLPVLAHGEEVSFADLGGEPLILPNSPFYFLKEIRRAMARTFAFTTARKAEVALDQAREELAEIKKLAEKSPQAKDALEKAETNYREHFTELKQHLASLEDKNKNTEKLIEKLGDIAQKHEKVFDEVEELGSITAEELKDTETALLETLNEAAVFDKETAREAFKNLKPVVKELDDDLGQDLDEKELLNNIDDAFKELKELYDETSADNEEEETPAASAKTPSTVCAQIYKPVCGADGKTYPNSCEAKAANVALKYEGECRASSSQTGPCNGKPLPELASPPAGCSYEGDKCSPKLACEEKSETTPASASPVKIQTTIKGFAFEKEIKVPLGSTVTWTNADSVGHTVTADDNSFGSGILSEGASFSFTFNRKGKFTYFCKPHPWMTGAVVVE